MRTHHPATAHLTRGAVKILILERQPLENALGLRLQLITIMRDKGIHGMRIGIAGVIMLGLALAQSAHGLSHLRRGTHGNLEHRAVRRVTRLLRQVAHHGIIIHDNFALIRRILPEDHAEERRLTGPVRPYQRDALPPVHHKLRIGKQRAPGVGLR